MVMKAMIQSENDSRGEMRIDCTSEVLCDLGSRKIRARLLDMSWSGIRLESERPIPAGTLIQLRGETTVWCICRWCSKTPEGRYWSGHELRNGALSPSQQWVREILQSNGLGVDRLRNRRRVRRYETQIPSLVQGQSGATVVNLSLFGACVVLESRHLERDLTLELVLNRRQMGLQATCLQTRSLENGKVAHHLSWESRPSQTRAVAFLLSTEESTQ